MFLAIVPAFNEEERISEVVRSLLTKVDRVVVVDDGSNDATGELALQAGAVVLRHSINRGQGAALQTGQEYALLNKADYVLHFDGDGQFSIEDINPAWQKIIDTNADILLGSRFLDQRSKIPSLKRIFLTLARKMLNLSGMHLKLTDLHNGFRILNRVALNKIILNQDGMAHASEIEILTKENNLKFTEFPVNVTYYEFGQGLRSGLKIIKDLILNKFIK